MAQRDRNQGFAFVYVDVNELLRQNKAQAEKNEPAVIPQSPSINFNKDPIATASSQQAVKQIRENLDRLQTLHHKLHAMLHDLNQISDPNKKRK